MDWPILKHIDVLIGLAVVMLITATLVVAVTQFVSATLRTRSRYLRETLTELVSQVAPKLPAADARYVAERLLRHPLVGRKAWLTSGSGLDAKSGLPLPDVARGEVILRPEIIVALLEWAAVEGPMALQDRELLASRPEARPRMEALIESLREALRECGIADPAQAVRDVRANLVAFESENPQQPSQVWHTQALVRTGLGDLTGRVFAWYDNSMERVTEFFSIEAKVVTSLIGLAVCVVIQLDSIGLLRRLSEDERFRAAMVAKADLAKKLYEDAAKLPATAELEEKGKEAEAVIRESVEALRDPKTAAVSGVWVWDEVAQLAIDRADGLAGKLDLQVDAHRVTVEVAPDCAERFPACPAGAIRRSSAPVDVYTNATGVVLVARSGDVTSVQLKAGERSLGRAFRARDAAGFGHRFPGVLLSWVLVSLGAPFWYDLLKKLLGLRSILQSKDDKERETRRGEQKDAPEMRQPAEAVTAPSALTENPGAVVTDRAVSLRAAPAKRAAVTRELPAGYLVNVEGHVTGEAVNSATGANPKWHQTVEGDYVWDGEVRP